MLRRAFLLVAIALAACGSSSDEPAPNADRRMEVAAAPEGLRNAARSVALAVQVSALPRAVNGRQPLATKPIRERLELCAGERYEDQPSATVGFGTGFLVAPDVVATAKHVLEPVAIDDLAFAFGYALDAPDASPPDSVAEVDVFRAKSATRAPNDEDWALVTLERPVPGRAPLALRRSGSVAVDQRIAVIGHPLALPMKVAPGEVKVLGTTLLYIDTDTYQGNSGSPVLNADTLEVEGLFFAGGEDHETTPEGCLRAVHRAPNDLTERAVSAKVFASSVPR